MKPTTKLLFILIFLITFNSNFCIAEELDIENDISLETFCLTNPCRKNIKITLRHDKGEMNETLPLYWPAALKSRISLLPGDKLFIEATVQSDEIGDFKQVQEITNKDITLIFSFTQMDSDNGMMLSVKNPFSKSIKYHLNMIDFAGNPHNTSSCPVMANLSVFESWGHPIPELVLTEMHFVDSKDSVCIY